MATFLDSEPINGLSGQLLIAMPSMSDPNFSRTVIYLCAHSEEGAMGLIINREADNIDFSQLIGKVFTPSKSTPIQLTEEPELLPYIHIGGPMESSRGFVLHSSDYNADEHTFPVNDTISLTATLEILKAIANGTGPTQSLLALGYAGWAAGQLEEELSDNGWLHCPATQDIVFNTKADMKYTRAFETIGINPVHLASETGHA